jgi:hypothetical protein
LLFENPCKETKIVGRYFQNCISETKLRVDFKYAAKTTGIVKRKILGFNYLDLNKVIKNV